MQRGPRGETRPTLKCLKPLGLPLPNIENSLEDLEHPLIKKAQDVARGSRSAPGSQAPIQKITDGAWLKVKVNDWRGGIIEESPPDVSEGPNPGPLWWLGMAGRRYRDSPQNDFYASLPVKAAEFRPTSRDWKRLQAEKAYWRHEADRQMVRSSVWRAYQTGDFQRYDHSDGRQHFGIKLTVRHPDEIYVSLGAHSMFDPRAYALLLSTLPEIPTEHWMAEPSAPLQLEVDSNEIVYSAVLPENLLSKLRQEAHTFGWRIVPD